MKKRYYRIEFTLQEPLSIGSGDSKYSDKDILKNGKGVPFIPATSLCGVYRSILEKKLGSDVVNEYFGSLANEECGSCVKVYDGTLAHGTYSLGVRDSVGLDEFKVGRPGAKFDFELVEPGASFVTYLEQELTEEHPLDMGAIVAEVFFAGQIYLGQKTMRGCGCVQSDREQIRVKTFDLDAPEELDRWLDFDMYDVDAFTAGDCYEKQAAEIPGEKADEEVWQDAMVTLTLDLAQRSGISIREYTTDLVPEGASQPDYIQMHYDREGEAVPYIPGSSWAGAFRHHISGLVAQENVREAMQLQIFGKADHDREMKRSQIRFSESQLGGGHWRHMTRTAVDRFTGGVVDGALYTERFYYGGYTRLTISLPRDLMVEGIDVRHLLAVSVADLHMGFLAIGGLTSIGRGIFEVRECTCKDTVIWRKDSEEASVNEGPALYDAVKKALQNTMHINAKGGRS